MKIAELKIKTKISKSKMKKKEAGDTRVARRETQDGQKKFLLYIARNIYNNI